MAYNELIAQRIRERLADRDDVREMKMMGGLTFMVNGKMCVGVLQDDLMARINPDAREQAFERPGCREMDFTGKPMKAFVFVGEEGTTHNEDLDYWIGLALEYNKIAKASPKKKKKAKAKK